MEGPLLESNVKRRRGSVEMFKDVCRTYSSYVGSSSDLVEPGYAGVAFLYFLVLYSFFKADF